jgi:lipoate-protein ligase A
VDSDLISPATASAVDEAILAARAEGSVPDTFHLYRRNSPSISLGHFERVAESVDLEAAKRLGVALVRRMSGGSAVYTDQDHLIYAVAVSASSMPESPQETFRTVCQGIIAALHELGVEAEFKPVNDVLVRGRKISGSAQVRRNGVVVQHGTLMVRTDYQRMFAVLRGKRPREGLTSLAEEITEPSMAEVKEAMVQGFSEALGAEMSPAELTPKEKEDAERLVRTRYGLDEHTYRY